MTRRELLKAAGLSSLASGQSTKRPNVVLMMADDLGYECLSCYGSTSYRTPNLDRMASSGVRFTHAYAQPLCTPTRVQLMTGQYNFRNWRAFGVMDPREWTFGHMMRDAGYKTCIAGKWQLYSYNPPDYEPEWRGRGMRPEQSGFDEYCLWHAEHTESKGSRYADPTILENGKYRTDLKGRYGEDVFCDYVSGFVERNRAQPFFVYYPMTLTHGPYMPAPISKSWASGNRLRPSTENFKDMVEYMDVIVGRVLSKLDRLGLRERTLVLFYSDNGTGTEIRSRIGDRVMQGGKGLTTDAGIHVPLIANWKGTAPEGRVLDDLVDASDFLPTIAEAAGASPPKGKIIDGRSFLPRLRGGKGNPREWVFFHYDPRPGQGKSQFTLHRFAMDHRWKLYADGRLFDVRDESEQRPLLSGQGGAEAEAARRRLGKVLASMTRRTG